MAMRFGAVDDGMLEFHTGAERSPSPAATEAIAQRSPADADIR